MRVLGGHAAERRIGERETRRVLGGGDVVIPSACASCAVGTCSGPGPAAVPASGWGYAVERAVWKVMLPSTFCTIWWM